MQHEKGELNNLKVLKKLINDLIGTNFNPLDGTKPNSLILSDSDSNPLVGTNPNSDFSKLIDSTILSLKRELECIYTSPLTKKSGCLVYLQTILIQLSEDCEIYLEQISTPMPSIAVPSVAVTPAAELSAAKTPAVIPAVIQSAAALPATSDYQNIVSQRFKVEYANITMLNLLESLKEDYRSQFNFQMRVPLSIKKKYNLTISKRWNKFLLKLKNLGVETDLLYVLTTYHTEMYTKSKLTFYDLDYWDSFITALVNIDLQINPNMLFNLFNQFCYYNFNYRPLVQYCITKVQRDYDIVDSYREEFIALVVYLRTLNQFIIKPNYGFDLSAESLKVSLAGILKDELTCLKKLMQVNNKNNRDIGAKSFLRQFYFRVSISIEQFIFIFRLLIEKDVVIVKRKADLYDFLQAHVGTIKKDHLSVGNMQNTYAENNRNTALKVKTILQSLIQLIDQKYL